MTKKMALRMAANARRNRYADEARKAWETVNDLSALPAYLPYNAERWRVPALSNPLR